MTKPKTKKTLFNMGRKDGSDWATGNKSGDYIATHEELERLTDHMRDMDSNKIQREDAFTFGIQDAYSAAERFYFCIQPDDDGDRQAAIDFWENTLVDVSDNHDVDVNDDPELEIDNKDPHDAYVSGFACGACDAAGGR